MSSSSLWNGNLNVFRQHPDAILPTRATDGSAGYDLSTVEEISLMSSESLVRFGWSFEIPPGYVGLLFMRSSYAKKGLSLANAVGVIDSDFRGEVKALLNVSAFCSEMKIEKGTRIAQLVIVPFVGMPCREVGTLNLTHRGEGGWGSTSSNKEEQK